MKRFKKFFNYSRKLEELQTVRKAKEVDEIRKFDVQLDAHKQHNFTQHLTSERFKEEHLRQQLEHIFDEDNDRGLRQGEKLQDVEAFSAHAQSLLSHSSQHDFEQIAEFQGFTPEPLPYSQKALPSLTCDLFAHEMRDVTEQEWQRELQENAAAISEGEHDRRRDKRQTAVEISPLEESEHRQHVDANLTILQDYEEMPESSAPSKEDEQATSTKNVFYFRPPHASSSNKTGTSQK